MSIQAIDIKQGKGETAKVGDNRRPIAQERLYSINSSKQVVLGINKDLEQDAQHNGRSDICVHRLGGGWQMNIN